ncbi:NADH-cytochrome b5 reductase [Kluyveromyces marxianus]
MSSNKNWDVLNEPLHGIYIPSLLFSVGIIVFTVMNHDVRFLSGFILLGAILLYRMVIARSRLKSIHTDKWTPLELVDQTIISKNTAIYRFKLKTSLESLNIPTGHHLAVRIPFDGTDEIRYYTPISNKFETGHFDILVKSYPEGKVSKYFAMLKPGQTVDFKGPVGRFNYEVNSSKHIGMIAGGTGLTPMLQVLNTIITTPEDLTKVTLIYANETENDVLLKDELDEISEKYPNFAVHYVVNHPSSSWDGETGWVTKDIMSKYLPEPSAENRLLICGKPEMKKTLLAYSEELGWPKGVLSSKGDDQVFVF